MMRIALTFGVSAALAAALMTSPNAQYGQQRADVSRVLMLDDTGSLANPQKLRGRIVEAITSVEPPLARLGVCLFSVNVLSAETVTIAVQALAGRSRIEHVNRRRQEEVRVEIRATLESLLAQELTKVPVTDLAPVFKRADAEAVPTLVITDGQDQTKRPATKLGSGDNVFVVICSAKGDKPADELDLFEARKAFVTRMLPNARVYACFELTKAINDWARHDGSIGLRRAASPAP